MKQYDTILFDLDGTLTDPGIGITSAVAYALHKFGIEVNDKTTLYPFIGPPLLDSFEKFYSFSREDARQALIYYREYYSVTGLYENTVYDGIPELLTKLKDSGKTLLVATSKPELFSNQILEHFHLADYFTMVAGASMDEVRCKKGDIIEYALETCHITDLDHVLMVGDREHDVFGAGQAGIDCAGVLYGYGSREELNAAGATYIAKDVNDLLNIINS